MLKVIIALLLLAAFVGLPGLALYLRFQKNRKTNDPNAEAERQVRKQAEKLKKNQDQQRLGYRFAMEDPFLFIHNKSVWTGVLMPTVSDDFTSPEQQEELFDQRTALHTDLLAFVKAQTRQDYVVCHQLMRYQPVDAQFWEENYLANCWNPTDLFRELVSEKVSPHLAETTPVPRRFLLIRLGDFDAPTSVDPVTMVLNSADHVAEEVFRRSDIQHYSRLAQQLHDQLGIEPMTRADLSWVIRKILAGHFDPDIEHDYVATRPWRRGHFDQLVDFEGNNLARMVVVENPNPVDVEDDSKSYIATLVVANSDPVVPFRYHQAWGRIMRGMRAQVGISWRYQLMTGAEWAKRSKRKIATLLDEGNDRAEAGKLDDEKFAVAYEQAAEMKAQNDLNPLPMMVGQLRFTVAAASPRELDLAIAQLKTAVKDLELDHPRRIQHALLREQLPGDPDPVHAGRVNMSVETTGIDLGTRWNDLNGLAIPGLESSPNVGDGVQIGRGGTVLGWQGHLIGYSAENGAAVHFDPHVQVDRHNGAGVGIIGASGGGKSSLALSLFFWMSEAGTQCVAADPKNDFEAMCYYLAFGPQVLEEGFNRDADQGILGTAKSRFQPINPDFWAETDIISLASGQKGMLGAWELTNNYSEGEALARAQLELLIPDESQRKRLEIGFKKMRDLSEAAELGGEEYNPSLSDLGLHLSEDIELMEQAATDTDVPITERIAARDNLAELQSLLSRLRNAEEAPFARLLFGGKGTGGFRSVRKRRTVLTMFGFTPPPEDKGPEEWSTSQRDAAAAIFTALHSINEFFTATDDVYNPTTGRRERAKRALFIDEGYILTAIEAGRDLMVRALRQGRSLRFVVVFISQQAGDINAIEKQDADDGEADQNQFATVFVFQQRGKREAEAALKLLREPEGDERTLRELAQRLMPASKGGSLRLGVCAMRDVDNRVGVMHVDPLFEELFAAEQTESRQKAIDQTREVPVSGADWTVDTAVRDEVRRGVQVASDNLAELEDHSFETDGYESMLGAASGLTADEETLTGAGARS